MAIEKQEYSHIGLTKQQRSSQTDDELRVFVPPTFNSLGSPSFTCGVITIDDGDEEETLEPMKKKPRLGSWWDEFDAFNELSSVFKGLAKPKDDASASIVDSSFSSTTNLHETMTKNKDEGDHRSLSSCFHDNFPDLCTYEGYKENQENQERVGYCHVSLENLGISVEDPSWPGGYDIISPVDSCYSSSRTDLLETETNTKKDDERSLLSSSHHDDNFIDISKEEIVGESTNRANRHMSLDDFGVSVEDLKSMPWEAFDPTWEIRSETMDPWLGGYIKDILNSPHTATLN